MPTLKNDIEPLSYNKGGSLSPYRRGDLFNLPSLSGVTNFNPFQMMRRMQEDMDRMWDQFGLFGPAHAFGTETTGTTGQMWSPSVDISESIKHWTVEVDLPGVNPDNIDVQVRDHSLSIRAELKQEFESPGKQEKGGHQSKEERLHYLRRERRYGYFERTIPLPENVEEEQISCNFKHGVLTMNIPKTEQAAQEGRRIPVGVQTEEMKNVGAQKVGGNLGQS